MMPLLINRIRWALIPAAAILIGAPLACGDDAKPAGPTLITAYSKPSKELKLVFAAPGIVMEVPVKEGDSVKAGQILAKQDDGQDQQDLAKLKMDAASTSEIEYDKADLAVKEVQEKRKEDMAKNQAASPQEVEEAQLQVSLDRAKIDVSDLQHKIKGFDALKQEIKVDRMQLRSPIDGKVQLINIHQGEMAAPDPSNREGAIVVVKNDPLWIEAPSMTPAQAQQLKVGQELQVRYMGEKEFQPAKIIFIAPEANPGSNSQNVRLELPNPSGRDSGLQMEVKLPDNMATVAENGNNP